MLNRWAKALCLRPDKSKRQRLQKKMRMMKRNYCRSSQSWSFGFYTAEAGASAERGSNKCNTRNESTTIHKVF